MQLPKRSVRSLLQEQVNLLQEETIESITLGRLVASLGLSSAALRALVDMHPDPRIDEMDRSEVEEWMSGGCLLIAQTPPMEKINHVLRLLGAIAADKSEIKILSRDIEFMVLLRRISPGSSLLLFPPEGRAFILYVLHTFGADCEDSEIANAISHYSYISERLKEAISYGAIREMLRDRDSDWRDFFGAIVGDLPTRPELSLAEIIGKMKKLIREPECHQI
jgi:hypothetical protein